MIFSKRLNSALTEDLVRLVLIYFWLHISVNLICLSNFSSVCGANTLPLYFSINDFFDDLEWVEDLGDSAELWDFKLWLDFWDLGDMDNFGLLYFGLELCWLLLFAGFDGISQSRGFSKLVLYRVSDSLHCSRKLSIVLVISITWYSWFLRTFIALLVSSGSIKSSQYSWLLLYIFSKVSSNFDNKCLIWNLLL